MPQFKKEGVALANPSDNKKRRNLSKYPSADNRMHVHHINARQNNAAVTKPTKNQNVTSNSLHRPELLENTFKQSRISAPSLKDCIIPADTKSKNIFDEIFSPNDHPIKSSPRNLVKHQTIFTKNKAKANSNSNINIMINRVP